MVQYLLDNLGTITTAVFSVGIVSVFIGKASKLLKEVSELLNALVVALADKKLTKEEIDSIIKEAKDIPAAVKEALKK